MIYKKYFAALFVVVVVCLPLSLFALVKFWQHRFQPLPVLSSQAVMPFQCTDQRGAAYSHQQWKGKIIVANLFFTRCPVVCPKMIYQLKRVQAYADVRALEIASFSVDPERDSVQQLKAFAERMNITGNNWHLLTGEKKFIYLLARKTLQLAAADGDGGPTDFIHSEQLVLLDRQGRIRSFYKGTDEKDVSRLIADCKRLAAAE